MTERVALPILPPDPDPEPTCDGCGACCRTAGWPPGYLSSALFAHVRAELREELEHTLAADRSAPFTRAQQGLPCLWWDGPMRGCRHYDDRPTACRRFTIATELCHQWRASIGLAPFAVERPRAETYPPLEAHEGEDAGEPVSSP